ncbi:hypothetical protein PROFUN_16407 [Planoprotostelium fungivorum]|uniref:Uncharacterized protein n=1 Tax=Planoprotostelium fungivorum TaxID=1890364 RepID=A0A2P6MQP8_9EUKA|nr:hypothetical protein PROFUN_16407 [Planoprotostelium fungivorum]
MCKRLLSQQQSSALLILYHTHSRCLGEILYNTRDLSQTLRQRDLTINQSPHITYQVFMLGLICVVHPLHILRLNGSVAIAETNDTSKVPEVIQVNKCIKLPQGSTPINSILLLPNLSMV